MDLKVEGQLNTIKDAILNFIVPLVSIVIAGLLFAFVVYPSFSTLPSLKEEKTQYETQLSALTKKLANLEKLVEFKSVVDENSNLVNRILVSEENVPQLLNQVDTIVRESGLEISKLSYSLANVGGSAARNAKETTSSYDTVLVSLGVNGSYDQVRTFLENTEKAARVINVTTFRYSLNTNGEQAGLISANLILSAPYLFVQSNAVTDDPVNLDITSEEFQRVMNDIKEFKYYEESLILRDLPLTDFETDTEESTASPEVAEEASVNPAEFIPEPVEPEFTL